MAFGDILEQYRGKYDMLQGNFGGLAPKQEQRVEEQDQAQEAPEEQIAAMEYLKSQGMLDELNANQGQEQQSFSQEEMEAFEKALNDDPFFKRNGKKVHEALQTLIDQINDQEDLMNEDEALNVLGEIIGGLK